MEAPLQDRAYDLRHQHQDRVSMNDSSVLESRTNVLYVYVHTKCANHCMCWGNNKQLHFVYADFLLIKMTQNLSLAITILKHNLLEPRSITHKDENS